MLTILLKHLRVFLQRILSTAVDTVEEVSDAASEAAEVVQEKIDSLGKPRCYYEEMIRELRNYHPFFGDSFAGSVSFIDNVISLSTLPRGIVEFWHETFVVDMALDMGLYHDIFLNTETQLGMAHKERLHSPILFLTKAKDNWIFAKPGLKYRKYWDEMVDGTEDGLCARDAFCACNKGFSKSEEKLPSIKKTVNMKEWCSPIDNMSKKLEPAGWFSALGYNEIYPRSMPPHLAGKYHSGYDLNRKDRDDADALVYAVYDGTVVYAGEGGKWYGLVVIQHGNGYFTRYGHVANRTVTKGQFIKGGMVIGKINGNMPYDAHLHFDIPKTNWKQTSGGITQEDVRRGFFDPKLYLS